VVGLTFLSNLSFSSRHLFGLCIVVLILKVLVSQLYSIHDLNNGLSYVVDPFSEGNTIRSAEGFVTEGLAKYKGLQNVGFGTRFVVAHKLNNSKIVPRFTVIRIN